MEEKELKTSAKQRFWIIFIAVVMLGSIIASYAAIIINGGNSSNSSTGIDQAKIERYTEEYEEKKTEFTELTKADFDEFVKYKSKITAYNEAAANGVDVKTEDLKKGDGKKIQDGDTDYMAYYVGWCADETVFDSVLDDVKNPKTFTKVLDAGTSGEMIEGWILGVEGMRMNGIRIITTPGTLAYGEQEICGGTNKPLKFMVMLKERDAKVLDMYDELYEAYMRLQYANYGIDYDTL